MKKKIIISTLAAILSIGMVFSANTTAFADYEYTVKPGDNLWKIAGELYGDGALYDRIVQANPGTITDPNLIYPGQQLVISDAEIPVAENPQPSAAVPDTDNHAESDIYIVYTNDVHSYVYNTLKDEEGNTSPGLRLSNVAAMVEDLRNEGKNVLLVDAGDEIQGDVYGAIDEGESIIELMNECGYQLATLGNHEFDYGTFTLFNRVEEADFPYISCNFHSLESEDPFAPVKIFDIGGKKVAFVGITTPETITSTTPTYFQNEKGEFIYSIDGNGNKNDLYASVQNAIDEVRNDADYVIALAHTGINIKAINEGCSSYDIIANVTGLDAYIDGHSHSIVESERVSDKDGHEVLLTQTGCYLNAMGLMKIGSEGISSTLISEYEKTSESVKALEDALYNKVQDEMGEVIGNLETTLYIMDPENPDIRFIRSREMNAGDFVADATYWYFNNKMAMDCDIAIVNGGSIRAQVEAGNVSYLDAKSITPFGNEMCMIEATGQNILDALEKGANVLGMWDESRNAPAETGGFLQVAGMKYSVDTSIPSSVKNDDTGMFVAVEGDYRVKDVMVFDRSAGEYKPLELDKTYRLAGINFPLRNGGDGMSMFTDCNSILDFADQDYIVLAEYMKSFVDADGNVTINTDNSPLSELKGYLINYEDPFGAGRITID